MKLSGIANWRQPREGDCLPACVAMLLTRLGEQVDYERLRQRLGTTEAGTQFSHLDRLRSLRLVVERSQGNLEMLRQYILADQPVIVAVATELLPYWLTRPDLDVMKRQIEHVVVLIGWEEQVVYVNDPDFDVAPQVVDLDWFADAWQGQKYRYAVIKRR